MTRGRILPILLVATMCIVACSRHVTSWQSSQASGPYSHTTSPEYDYFFLEAVRLQNKGDFAGAFDLLSHCVEIDSLAPEAYYILGVYYADLGMDSLADKSLKRAIFLNPKNDAYHERLAQWYLQTQEFGRAIDAYEYLFSNNKSRTDVLEILLKLYQQEKNYSKVLSTIERYEQVEGISEETTLTKLQAYQQKGEKAKGYKALKELCEEHPNDVNYKVLLGNWLYQNGRSDDAQEIFLEAENTDPSNEIVAISLYDFYRARGEDSLSQIYRDRLLLNKHTATNTKTTILQYIIRDSELQKGDSSRVLALFDDILNVDSTNVDVAELKASYMAMKGMSQDSINDVLRHILTIAPDKVAPRLQLLQSEVRREDLDGIIALCKPALIYNPDEIAFVYYLGLAYYQRGDTLDALDTFRKGTTRINNRSNADIVSDFYAIIGDIEHFLGNKVEAYAAYDSCLGWKPDNVGCLNNYAYYLSLDDKDLKKAETMSLKAINLEPNNATYLDTYAWVLYMQERYTEAKLFIDRTLENLDSIGEDSAIYEHAGDIYEACGENEKAVEFWKQALLLKPEDEATIRKKIKKYEK